MKHGIELRFWSVLLALVLVLPGYSATITWTNTAAGYWSVTANWSPNQVPGTSDTAVIPIAGTNGVTLDTTAEVENLILDGGNLYTTGTSLDTLTVNDSINWTNGILGCTVTNNGVMTLAGIDGVDYTLSQYLYNAGTFNVESGNLLINYCGYNSGEFVNAQGALLNLENDANIDISSNNFGLCAASFSNAGMIRKSGGAGTSHIYLPLDNSGTVDAQIGTISFNGGGDLGGTLQSEGTGSLKLGTNIYNAGLNLAGNLTSTNAILDGADLVGSGTINGVLTWISGAFVPGNGSLTVGTNGVLVLAGANGVDYSLSSVLTNKGTIELVSGNLQIDFCGSGFGELINEPGGLVAIENDVSIDSPCGGQLINQGMLRKSGGTGTSDIAAYFNNGSGVIDAQAGTLALTNNYNLSGGTLNFGIGSLTNFGRIYISGNSPLSGALSVSLDGGYYPANSNAFPLLTYGAENGMFETPALPTWITWQTNYSPTTFTLSVVNLNGRPILTRGGASAPGQVSLQFLGNPNASYSVLATTNLILPLTEWTTLGPATLISNNLFQYSDGHTTNYPQRFYELRSP